MERSILLLMLDGGATAAVCSVSVSRGCATHGILFLLLRLVPAKLCPDQMGDSSSQQSRSTAAKIARYNKNISHARTDCPPKPRTKKDGSGAAHWREWAGQVSHGGARSASTSPCSTKEQASPGETLRTAALRRTRTSRIQNSSSLFGRQSRTSQERALHNNTQLLAAAQSFVVRPAPRPSPQQPWLALEPAALPAPSEKKRGQDDSDKRFLCGSAVEQQTSPCRMEWQTVPTPFVFSSCMFVCA